MHKLGLSPVHMETKLFCLLTIHHQGVPQQTLGCAEQDGIVSVLQVGQLVTAKGHSGYTFTAPAHQVVDYAVEQVWGDYTALANPLEMRQEIPINDTPTIP